MYFRYMFCLAVAIAILMTRKSVARCYPSCQCVNITHVSTGCNITYDGKSKLLNWQNIFKCEVETIHSLYIFSNNVQPHPFSLQEFLQFNWSSLQELRGQNMEDVVFEMAYLENLPNLTNLILRLESMDLAASNGQSPLRLRYLDVSDNGYLTFYNLSQIITISGNALEKVYANRINDLISASLDDTFFEIFSKTNIRVFHAVNSKIQTIKSQKLFEFLPLLEEIDVTENTIEDYDYFLTSIGNLKNLKRFYGPSSLATMFRSYSCNTMNGKVRTEAFICKQISTYSNHPVFRTLEHFSLSGDTQCTSVFCLYTKCTMPEAHSIKILQYSNCCYQRFDAEMTGFHKLEIFDFSKNLCEYISPLALSDMLSLKSLLLNGNKLYKMESGSPDEFRNLTRNNINLTTFDLSSNGLINLPSDLFAFNTELNTLNLSSNLISNIPKGIFDNNPKLKSLDLSNNLLSAIDWIPRVLKSLRSLNISNNRITTLGSDARTILDSWSFIMILANNPLDCNCENNDLYVWLFHRKTQNANISEVFCTQTGIPLSSHISKIDSFSYECQLKSYIGLFGLSGIPVIMVICIVFYYRHYQNILRIRRIRKQLKEFAEENVPPKQHFLLYLAYSFADSETVLKHIFPELEAKLQRELNVADKLVCISDRDFDVGTNISDEIIRAVSSCTAVLFIISKEFASSLWCEFESEIAIYQQKPIIIVVLEQIKIKSFPSSLRKVCYKWTRMEWPGKDDVTKLEDFWKKLTKAVIRCTDVSY